MYVIPPFLVSNLTTNYVYSSPNVDTIMYVNLKALNDQTSATYQPTLINQIILT